MKGSVSSAVKIILKVLAAAAILAIAAIPAIFLNTIYGYFPAILLVIIMLISYISLCIGAGKIKAEALSEDIVCERGEEVSLSLQLYNSSPFIFSKAMAVLVIPDIFGREDSEKRINFVLSARDRVEFTIKLKMSHIGIYEVGLKEAQIYDFFGIFRKTMPLNGTFTAVVAPHLVTIAQLPMADEVLAESSVETRTMVAGGTDYTGVREYAMGDPMKQIHWKLSAHSRDYLTKLQENARMQEFAIIIDFTCHIEADSEELMSINDSIIETALSAAKSLEEENTDAQSYLIYVNKGLNPTRSNFKTTDKCSELIRDFVMINADSDVNFPDAYNLLHNESSLANRSSNSIVVTCNVTDELVNELCIVKQQRRSPELYVVVPSSWNSSQIKQHTVKLNKLNEINIPYHIVTNDSHVMSEAGA